MKLKHLAEVGRRSDMNNNHMLAIIEQKLFSDDRKVWSRFCGKYKERSHTRMLISWMTNKMRSRMRASYSVTAVGIPHISSDISNIRVNEVAKFLGLGEEEFRHIYGNWPVDILTVIDHPRLHTGETRQAANLAARHTPLTWLGHIWSYTQRTCPMFTRCLMLSFLPP